MSIFKDLDRRTALLKMGALGLAMANIIRREKIDHWKLQRLALEMEDAHQKAKPPEQVPVDFDLVS